MHTIQRVQTQSSTRALTGIGAEVNLLIASSQFQVTAHYSAGGGREGEREGSIMNQQPTRIGVCIRCCCERGSSRIRYWDNEGINFEPFRSSASRRFTHFRRTTRQQRPETSPTTNEACSFPREKGRGEEG